MVEISYYARIALVYIIQFVRAIKMTKQHGVLEYLNAFLRQIKIRFIRINSAKKDEKNTNSRDIDFNGVQ